MMEESRETFEEFLEVVKRVEHGDDLVAMLQRRYAGTNPHFLWNREFISTVTECQQQILNNKDKSYVYLANFNTTLKEFATKPLKHLLSKNGVSKSPELDDDVRCEALLNSLAKQQRQSSVTEDSRPPLKRQRFLGVNENNEVIIVEDQVSGSPAASPHKQPLSPVHSQHAGSFYGMPSRVCINSSQIAAPANGCVVGSDVQLQTVIVHRDPQLCNNQAAVADEVICIDDDEDDAVLLVTDHPKSASSAGMSLVSDEKPSADAVTLKSLPAVKSSSVNDTDDGAVVCVNLDDTADSEQLPSSSDQVTGNCLSTQSSVDEHQHASSASMAASTHHSPLSRKVARLENLLTKLSNRIKKLQESELTLEDMDSEDTNFVLEEKFTRKFVKVWEKLCQLKNRPTSTGRATEHKFVCELERYPEIADKISSFVNKRKCFPDYQDILDIVQDCNSSHAISLSYGTAETLAREIFTEVGNKLQQRRLQDFIQNFGCHLTDEYRPSRDPAASSDELRKRLVENRKTGQKRLDEVIDKFVEKQEQAADHADDDEADANDNDENEENGDDDDVEPSDHDNTDNDVVIKVTSDTVDSAPAGVAPAEEGTQECVDDADYEWSVNISSTESEDDTAAVNGEETKECIDDADYEWSVNVSSTESEDDAAVNGFSKTFLITCDTGAGNRQADSTEQTQCNTIDTTVLFIDDDDDDDNNSCR